MTREELEALWQRPGVASPGRVVGLLEEVEAACSLPSGKLVVSLVTGGHMRVVQADGVRQFLPISNGDDVPEPRLPVLGQFVCVLGRQKKGPPPKRIVWPDPPLGA